MITKGPQNVPPVDRADPEGEREHDGRAAPRRVGGRQSNHEEYRLPAALAHLPWQPLYLAVAQLGLILQQPLTREMICTAFGIETRRALEVMRYLAAGQARVQCERLACPGSRGYQLVIHAVLPAEDGERASTRPAGRASPGANRRRREAQQQQLRQWFLRRPNPADGEET